MTYKIAPEDSSYWKCKWLQCAGGMGLAGAGICSFRGDWSDPSCPKFITDKDYERKCHLEYIAATPAWKRIIRPAKWRIKRWFILICAYPLLRIRLKKVKNG